MIDCPKCGSSCTSRIESETKNMRRCANCGNIFETNWVYPIIEDGKPTKWGWIVRHPENFKLGKDTDIGAFTYIQAKYGVTIEDEVLIGSHCSIYSISTINDERGPIILKKNCRIGSHTVILPCVVIGENSIIGAASYIDRDVAPNVIVIPKSNARGLIIKKKKRNDLT